jgi:exosortase
MLPTVDDDSWCPAAGLIWFLVPENAAPTKCLENGSQALGTPDRTPEEGPPSQRSRTGTWFGVSLLSALAAIMYAPVLGSLARQWWDDPNYGHGFFVPLFAAYILWRERYRSRAVPRRSSNFGLSIMLFAAGLLILGTLGAELFTTRISLVFLIAGIIVFLAGWQALRSVAFPIGYLVFMIPLPAIVYYQLMFPLQLWASRLGANGLVVLGVRTIRQGNLLILPNCTLEVVEACSGVRSLLSLLAAVVAYGYLAEPSIWKRCALAVATIPIVILSNGLRLVATGVLSFFFGPGVDSGAAHLVVGSFSFILAFLSILLIHELLRRLPSQRALAPEHS